MKKLTVILIPIILLMASCSTSGSENGSDIVVEATLPTENGELTFVMWPEPALHGNLEFVIGE